MLQGKIYEINKEIKMCGQIAPPPSMYRVRGTSERFSTNIFQSTQNKVIKKKHVLLLEFLKTTLKGPKILY